MSWHSSVDIAIGSELDGPEIESRWDEILRTRSDRRQGPPGGGLNGLGLNGLGVALTTRLHLGLRLKEKYSYLSPPLLDLRSLFQS